MASGAWETVPTVPALSRVWNSTRVPAPKLVPCSSMTWPTLAAASAALAATPWPAPATMAASVAEATATGSAFLLIR